MADLLFLVQTYVIKGYLYTAIAAIIFLILFRGNLRINIPVLLYGVAYYVYHLISTIIYLNDFHKISWLNYIFIIIPIVIIFIYFAKKGVVKDDRG